MINGIQNEITISTVDTITTIMIVVHFFTITLWKIFDVYCMNVKHCKYCHYHISCLILSSLKGMFVAVVER